MAEPVAKNIDDEEIIKITDSEQEQEQVITDEENKEESANSEANNSLTDLAGINLVMIVSLLSLSAEECQNLEEEEEEKESNHLNHKKKKKATISRSDFVIRKREIHEFRAAERQTTKVHAKIRDCRHSRRL